MFNLVGSLPGNDAAAESKHELLNHIVTLKSDRSGLWCALAAVLQVQYILCIRPNMENNPVLFEDEYVTQQLLSASIVEAAQVF